jgi:ABC-type glycerol-3-phosphate transport system substrate-binding protein
MTGRGRMAWRLAGVTVATLVVMAGCSTGTPAPDRAAPGQGSGSATTAAPLPAAVTLPPAPSGRPATGLVGTVGSEPGSIALARLDPATLQPLPGPRVELEVNVVGWSVSADRSLAAVGDGNGAGLVQVVDLGAMRRWARSRSGPGA